MSKRPYEGSDTGLSKKSKNDATPSSSGGAPQLSADALIAAKRAEIAAKLAAFKKTPAGSAAPPAPAPKPPASIAAPTPSLPSKPALPDKSDIARKIEEAKRRVAEGVAKKAIQENPYIAAAPSKKKTATPQVDPVQQGSGLKMAAHPLLLDTAPTQLSQSKKDRYKPMLPKFASIKANVRNQPSPSPAPTHTPTPVLDRGGSASANPYAAGGGAAASGDGTFEGATPAVKERIGRTFRFNQKGKYVAMANQMRQEAQLEALKQKIAESARKAGLDSEFETLERNIRREAPPAVEWWDASLLPGKSYDDLGPDASNLSNTLIRSQDSPISMYVQHPIPVPAPWEKNEQALKPLKLTSKEAKKVRRRRRMADLQEKQDRVRMGLLPPDPPKVRLANLMRVLTTDAVQDPTKVEARVRREVAARKIAHDEMNTERKLTDEQRREKVENKKSEEERKGIYVAVFKIKTLSDPAHRFKVRKNAEQYGLTGMCIFNPSFALVVVEGSAKAIKGYKRLMTVRIDWTQAAGARDGGEDAPPPKDEQDEEGGPVSLENNRCDLVFEGPIREHSFQSFKPKRCPTDAMAKEALGAKAASYWDTAKTFVEDVYS